MKIYRYQKESDAHTTYTAQGAEDAPIYEHCTIGDFTYISAPETLPPQPEQITVEPVELTAELRESIKRLSPHCQLITQRMEAKIRQLYSADDEIFLTRIGVGQALGSYQMSPGEQQELAAYQQCVEGVREWGRAQRAEMGL